MNDLERAIALAVDAHAVQTDKAGATYIRHPLRVMESVETERERVVAVLHDVVEDTRVSPEEIEEEFDTEIRTAVEALTKEGDDDYLEFVERLSENPLARSVKIADIEDNMDLTRFDELDENIAKKQATYHEAWQLLREVAGDDRAQNKSESE